MDAMIVTLSLPIQKYFFNAINATSKCIKLSHVQNLHIPINKTIFAIGITFYILASLTNANGNTNTQRP